MGECCGSDRVAKTQRTREIADTRRLLDAPSCSEEQEDNEIVSVELLEGDDTVDADVLQWVNLAREDKWTVGTTISHIDRCSRQVRVKVTFTEAGAENFTLKMVGANTNVAYSNAEKGRNAAYKTTPEDITVASAHTTGAGGTVVIDSFRVPAAGGHRYHFEATDSHGNTVQSKTLTTWRMIFLQYLPMAGSTPPQNIDTTRAEYRKHHVELVDLAPQQMGACPVDLERLNAFKTTARLAYAASDCAGRKPHVIAVVSALHAAQPGTMVYERNDVPVGPAQPDLTLNVGTDRLWYDMGDDRSWLVKATLLTDPPRRAVILERKSAIFDRELAIEELQATMLDTDPRYAVLQTEYDTLERELDTLEDELDTLVSTETDIPIGNCTPLQSSLHPVAHQMRRVRIRVSNLSGVVKRGRVVLNVRQISYWRGGTSINVGNIVCVATQSQWQAKDSASQKQVLIHELGHKIGMVPKADHSNCDLDAPPYVYEGRGHNGPHCHAGVQLQDDFAGVNEGMTCAMWGSTAGPTTFCDDCSSCVRRVNLGTGFADF